MTDIKVWESYSKHDIGAGAHDVLPAFSFYVPTFRPLGIVYVVNFHYICRYETITLRHIVAGRGHDVCLCRWFRS